MEGNITESTVTEVPINETEDNEVSGGQKRKASDVESIEEEGPETKKQKIDDQPAPQRGLYKRDDIDAPKYLPPLPVASVKQPILLGHHLNKSDNIINNSNFTIESHNDQNENNQRLSERVSKISEDQISIKTLDHHDDTAQRHQNNQHYIESNNMSVNINEHVETKSEENKENSTQIQNQQKPEVTQDSNEDIVKYLSIPIVSFITVTVSMKKNRSDPHFSNSLQIF